MATYPSYDCYLMIMSEQAAPNLPPLTEPQANLLRRLWFKALLSICMKILNWPGSITVAAYRLCQTGNDDCLGMHKILLEAEANILLLIHQISFPTRTWLEKFNKVIAARSNTCGHPLFKLRIQAAINLAFWQTLESARGNLIPNQTLGCLLADPFNTQEFKTLVSQVLCQQDAIYWEECWYLFRQSSLGALRFAQPDHGQLYFTLPGIDTPMNLAHQRWCLGRFASVTDGDVIMENVLEVFRGPSGLAFRSLSDQWAFELTDVGFLVLDFVHRKERGVPMMYDNEVIWQSIEAPDEEQSRPVEVESESSDESVYSYHSSVENE